MTTKYNWNKNYPPGRDPFIGLYINTETSEYEPVIIRRASAPMGDPPVRLQFVTEHGGPPHYVMDPVAWAKLPDTEECDSTPVCPNSVSRCSAGSEKVNCDCGFSAEVCKTNPCMRKKIHRAGLTTGDGTGNGRTTKPELTGSPSGTPQGAGNFSERWEIDKNGWDASDEATREDI